MATAGLISAAIGGGVSLLGGAQTNAANRQISADQMAFQKEMSSTAYQRSMADMRKAGLNPILAYKQGGAQGASGAGIPAVNTIEKGIASAMALRRQTADLRQVEASTNLTNHQAKIAERDAMLKGYQVRGMIGLEKKVESWKLPDLSPSNYKPSWSAKSSRPSQIPNLKKPQVGWGDRIGNYLQTLKRKY